MILGKAIGDYRILAWLEYGESACVYKAFHSLQGRIYALALLQTLPAQESALQGAFLDRLNLATTFSHPGVGRVYTPETCEDLVVVPLEFVPGRTLWEKIKDGQSSFDFALRVGSQVTEVLTAAHSIGLVHGRLTPKCLVVSSDGGLRVLDFALPLLPEELARSKSQADLPFATLTLSHPVSPTIAYLSPEQLEGFPANASSDLYSLGLILYELLGGQFLVQADSSELTRQRLQERDLPGLDKVRPDASPQWSGILDKLTRRKTSERYQSAEALLSDLKKLRDGFPTSHLSFTQKKQSISRRSFFLRFLGEAKK